MREKSCIAKKGFYIKITYTYKGDLEQRNILNIPQNTNIVASELFPLPPILSIWVYTESYRKVKE